MRPQKGKLTLLFLLAILIFPLSSTENLLAADLTPVRFETDNGMDVLTLEQNSLPIVTIQVLVKAGSVLDPKGKTGLANMTLALLEAGTETRTAMEISEATDFIGATLRTRASQDYVMLQLRLLKKDINAGMALLSDILINPAFIPEEIARIQKQITGNILAQQDQPGAIARIAFQEMVYASHPYRSPVIGREKSIASMTQRDLITFHQIYYRPNNTIVAIVGDIGEGETKDLIEKYFGNWEKQASSLPVIEAAEPIWQTELRTIEKDLSQATVILGHIGINRANPDFYAIHVMNYILGGGGFSSRMMSDVRDNKGLVYSIYSYFSTRHFPGAFAVSFQTKNSSVNEAIEAVLREINQMRNAAVTEEELSEAKAYLSGVFPLKIDTGKKLASLLAEIAFHNLGLDYFNNYQEQIMRVTREDVFHVAMKYLHPDRYAIVVIGKQDAIALKLPENRKQKTKATDQSAAAQSTAQDQRTAE